ncbi:MAG: glycoside hydrolase family 113, partial [Candidatus Dormibacteraceae bacterium]
APDTLETVSPGLDADSGSAAKHPFPQAWLTCAALYYPIFWVCASAVQSARSLVRWVFLGGHLTGIRLSFFAADFVVRSPRNLGNTYQHWTYRNSTWMVFLVVLVAVILIMLLARRRRMLAGLTLGTLGNIALVLELSPGLFESRRLPGMWGILSAGCYLVVLAVGLLWLLAGWPAGERLRSYHRRLTILVSTFVLLPLLLFCWLRFSSHFLIPRMAVLAFVAPATLAAIVLSFWRVRRPRQLPPSGWRPANFGLVATCVVIFGVQQGARAIDKVRIETIRKILAAYPQADPLAPYPTLFFQKGVNFTVEGPDGYSSDEGRQVLESLPQYGVNAVALVPYGFTRQGHSPTVGFGGWERDDQMRVAARVAHSRGMKVMLKPAIWDASNLQIQSPEERQIWFEQYQKFLEHYARLAVEIHADIFCIGGEFTHL